MASKKWDVWYWNVDLGVLSGEKPQRVFDTLKEAVEYGDKLWKKLDRNGLSDMMGVHIVEVEEEVR